METRRLLQIVLGAIVTAIVLVAAALVYELTRSPETTIIQKTFEKKKTEESVEKNPWEGRGDEAVELVRTTDIEGLDDAPRVRRQLGVDEGESVTLGEALDNETFFEETLRLEGTKPRGWRAEWWGETKYGPHFYLVTYEYEDGHVAIGPEWLVDLENEEVVPKNVTARVASNPDTGKDSKYHGKRKEVVSAMVRHTFESGINLGGTLLVYFEERAGDAEGGGETEDEENGDDTEVLGWTIQHNRKDLFTAYFQWMEEGEPSYAEFEFDYDRKALRAVNLHAGSIMREGESYEEKEPVDILPKHFNQNARSAADQWTGPAAEKYRNPRVRKLFDALATILNDRNLISALEWLFRTRAKTPEQFEECKEKEEGEKQPDCSWRPKPKKDEEGAYRVAYHYNLGEGTKKVKWDVYPDREENQVEPVDPLSTLVFRTVNPR